MVTCESAVVRLVFPYAQPESYHAVPADGNAILDDRAATHETARANGHAAIDYRAGRDVTVVVDHGVMLDQRGRVDDAIPAHPGAGIDDRTVHQDGACTNTCVGSDVGRWRNNAWQDKTKLDGAGHYDENEVERVIKVELDPNLRRRLEKARKGL